jgi:DNA-binding CsgD family transcriptional regulator
MRPNPLYRMSETQMGIIWRVANSQTRKQIAKEMCLKPKKVERIILQIYALLGFDPKKNGDALLTLWAAKSGLIELYP